MAHFSKCSSKITSTTAAGGVADLKFQVFTSASTNSSSAKFAAKMTILGNGNVGIGITNPSNILQVGDGARLRIGWFGSVKSEYDEHVQGACLS